MEDKIEQMKDDMSDLVDEHIRGMEDLKKKYEKIVNE